MKQVVQNLKDGETQVIDVPVPDIQEGQLLVKTVASLVSAGTERSLVSFAEKSLFAKARSRPDLLKQVVEKAINEGLIPTLESALNRLDQPLVLGYSSTGIVVEIGRGVSGFKPGDKVACAGGNHAVHAEYALIPVNLAAHLPANVDFESGAFATLGAIALNGIRLANPQAGEQTVVIGMGLLGIITAQIMRACGCLVTGVDIDPKRTRLGKKLGFQTFNNQEITAYFQSLTHGRGFDHVLICADTPSDDTVELAGLIARDRGHVISLGVVGLNLPRKPFFEKELFFQVSRSSGPGRYDLIYEEKGVDYPLGYVRWTEGRNLEAFLGLLHNGRVDVKPLITHRFTIEDAKKAYELITGKTNEDFLGVLLTYPNGEHLPARRIHIKPIPINSISSTDEVSLGVIGAGLYANVTFLPTIKKNSQTHFVGIASASGLSAQNSGRKFNFQFATSSDKEIFESPEINTVAILTRHQSHADLVTQGLKSGKHVYCEKPLAISKSQADQVTKLIQKGISTYLMVGYNRRFAPFSQKIKQFFSNIPEPYYICYRVNAGYLPPTHWLHVADIGGGRLIGEGCHFIDYLTFIIGDAPVSVSVTPLPDQGKYRGDNFVINLNYPDGSIGIISYLANGSQNVPKEYCEIFSSGKSAILNDFRELQLIDQGRRNKFTSRFRQDKGHQAAWNAFVQAILTNSSPPIAYADIISTTYATLACDASMRRGERIYLADYMIEPA